MTTNEDDSPPEQPTHLPAQSPAQPPLPLTEQPAAADTRARTDFWNNPRPTNENPNFVSDYFQSSRLHFIGSFRARYESMMVSVGKKLSVNPAVLLQNSVQTGVASSKKKSSERVIVHIDMDAFFASVAVRDRPELAGLPVAVCHAAGEISSCTYEARECGVRAGMFLRDARKQCPQLHAVPYDFDAYEKVSIQIYARFFQYPHVCVEAVSVDEAYLDLTLSCATTNALKTSEQGNDLKAVEDGVQSSQSPVDALVSDLRHRIYSDTKCTASAGIGPSKLVARLATKAAKPNGQYHVRPSDVTAYIDTLAVRDLPGIGWRTGRRLDQLGITAVPQLRAVSLPRLQAEFGHRQGSVFHDLARAIDARPVEPLKPRKSIGAEVSWGVRFQNAEHEKTAKFIADVADEVALRVAAAGAYGTKVVYKVYKRVPNASMKGYKHLGHGPCTIVTRSGRLPQRVVGEGLKAALRDLCLRIHADLRIEGEEFRGVGIQVCDLTFADLKFDHASMPVAGTRRIETFFTATSFGKLATVSDPRSAFAREKPSDSIVKEIDVPEVGVDGLKVEVRDTTEAKSDLDEASDGIRVVKSLYQEFNDEDCIEKGPVRDGGPPGRAEVPVGNEDEAPVEIGSDASGDGNDFQRNGNDVEDRKVDIPLGWDSEVFEQLPKELQEELLKGSSCENAGANRNRRRRMVQQHNPLALTENVARKRGRPRNDATAAASIAKDRIGKRKKQGAQVTMTQFAHISELRKTGTEVLHASEFRERPLHECVELIADLQGPCALGGPRKVIGQKEEWRGGGGGTAAAAAAAVAKDSTGDWDIPSPPTVSSDSGDEGSGSGIVTRYAAEESNKYADECVWEYADLLKEWMQSTAGNIETAHVDVLRGRLLELLQGKRLERVCEDFRTLRLFAQDENCMPWIRWYNRLLNETQSECMRLYNFRLSLSQIKEGSD